MNSDPIYVMAIPNLYLIMFLYIIRIQSNINKSACCFVSCEQKIKYEYCLRKKIILAALVIIGRSLKSAVQDGIGNLIF